MQRIRIHYAKNHRLRYTSTQDIQKNWERILRRARLPIAYSQGFHPQPKIQLACPLPLGMLSQAEYVDFWLEDERPLQNVLEDITAAKHAGIDIRSISEVPTSDPALQSRLRSVTYRIRLEEVNTIDDLTKRINQLLEQDHIWLERRGKKYDLRPLIETCEVQPAIGRDTIDLTVTLTALPGATGRPEELLRAAGYDPNEAFIERQEIHFQTAEN